VCGAPVAIAAGDRAPVAIANINRSVRGHEPGGLDLRRAAVIPRGVIWVYLQATKRFISQRQSLRRLPGEVVRRMP
jgi:hypothetical protein